LVIREMSKKIGKSNIIKCHKNIEMSLILMKHHE
jgi:hypothetical protein